MANTGAPKPLRGAARSALRPTPEEILDIARGLKPRLAERAAECEALGKLPNATVEDLRRSGLFRVLQPAKYGGYEYDPMVHYRAVMELAEACPSTAWVFSILGIHQWETGLMDPRMVEDLYGENPDTLFSSSYAPYGKAEKVAGGYVVTGRWPWSSGCDLCEWVILGALAETEDGERNLIAFPIKRPDYRPVEGSWEMVGMAGTGSKTIAVDGAFVPDYRKHNVQRSILMDDVGLKTFNAPTYRHPFGIVFAYTLATAALGAADAAYKHFVDYMRKRTNAFDGSAFKEDPITQHALAEAYTLLDGAHLRLERDFREMGRSIAAGEPISIERRVAYKFNSAQLGKAARQTVNSLVEHSGGTTFERKNPMQRYFRDVNTMTNHLYINPRNGAVNLGLNILSGGNRDPLV